MKRKALVIISSLVFVVAGVAPVNAQYVATPLELNPKIGGCYLFTAKELDAASPLTNPIPCAKTHNAETYWVAQWPLKLAPTRYTDDLIYDAAKKICLRAWDFTDKADLNYWGFFQPSPSQWAKGARWLRCDALVQKSEKGTFSEQYRQWKGSAVLNDGFINRSYF
jgi:hypothetical protein